MAINESRVAQRRGTSKDGETYESKTKYPHENRSTREKGGQRGGGRNG